MLSKQVLNSKYKKVKECNNNRKNNKLTKGKWPHAKLSTRVPLYSDLKGEYSKFHMSRTAIAKLTTKESFRVEKLHKTQVQVIFFFEINCAIFYINLNEFFCQFISWTNWVNSGKFMDNCWISRQVMADMYEKSLRRSHNY